MSSRTIREGIANATRAGEGKFSLTDFTRVRWGCTKYGCDMPATRSDPVNGQPLCLNHRRRVGPVAPAGQWSRDVREAADVMGLGVNDLTVDAIEARHGFLVSKYLVLEGGGSRLIELDRARSLLLSVVAFEDRS